MVEAATAHTISPETRQLLVDLFGGWNGQFPKPGLSELVELPEYRAILVRFKEARDKGETLHLKGFQTHYSGKNGIRLNFQPTTFDFGYIVKGCYTSEVKFTENGQQKVMKGPGYVRMYDVIATGKFNNGVARCISLSDLLPAGHEQRADLDLEYPNEFLEIVEEPVIQAASK